MKFFYLILILSVMSSCANNLSKKIKKSQLKYYRDVNVDKQRLDFFYEARKFVFNEINFESTQDNFIMYMVEAYDITSGDLSAVIILNDKKFYYEGSNFRNKFWLSNTLNIDQFMIDYYLTKEYEKLKDSLRFSSTIYIGTEVVLKNGKYNISHHRWW